MAARSRTTPPEDLTFEQAMAELESIIERIESGESGLEESLAQYERGVALIKRCRSVLQRAEQRVEHLKIDGEDSDPTDAEPGEPAEPDE